MIKIVLDFKNNGFSVIQTSKASDLEQGESLINFIGALNI